MSAKAGKVEKDAEAARYHIPLRDDNDDDDDDDAHDVHAGRRRRLLDSLSRSVVESFRAGHEASVLPVVPECRGEGEEVRLGWIRYAALLVCMYYMLVTLGVTSGLSVLYVPTMREFNSSSAQAGLIQSLTEGICYGGGVVSGLLVTRFGPGACSVVGSLMTSLGLLASAFATSVPFLIGSVGVLAGAGMSLMVTSGWAVSGLLATSLPRASGALMGVSCSMGMLTFPPIYSLALDLAGWRAAYLVMAAISAVCFPGSIILIVAMRKAHGGRGTGSRVTGQGHGSIWELCRNWRYVVYTVTVVLYFAFIWSPLLFVVDMAVDLGLDISTGSSGVVVFGAMAVVIRIVSPIFDRIKVPSLVQSGVFTVLSGVAAVFVCLAYDRTTLMLAMGALGLTYGLPGVAPPIVVLKELQGHPLAPTAVGFILGAMGIGETFSGPLGGAIRDITGKYDIMFYACAGVGVVCGLTQLLLASACWRCGGDYTPLYGREGTPGYHPQPPSDTTTLLEPEGVSSKSSRTEERFRKYDTIS